MRLHVNTYYDDEMPDIQNITKDTNDVTEVFNFRLGTSF